MWLLLFVGSNVDHNILTIDGKGTFHVIGIIAILTLLLFAGGNVNHNILTIDGNGIFHGMGIIAILKPGHNTKLSIPRRKSAELKFVEKTKQLHFANHVSRNIKLQELPKCLDCYWRFDILWGLSFNFKWATPNWNSMMHMIH